MTTNTQALRDLANEVATTLPDLGRKLHALAGKIGPMEKLLDEYAEQARQDEWRALPEDQGVVVLPAGVWGRG